MTISEQFGLRGGPLVFDTPTLHTKWQPVRPARRRGPAADLELSNSIADARSVGRIQAALAHARTATPTATRAPARPGPSRGARHHVVSQP